MILIRSILFGGIAAAVLCGVAHGQPLSTHAVPFTEREYQKKQIFGADADDYWTGYWDWYDNTYRPYYYRSRVREARRPYPEATDAVRNPALVPDYHDYYTSPRAARLRTPSYYYPSSGVSARVYDWR